MGWFLARTGPTTQETRARPSPHWWFYRKAPEVSANQERVHSLFSQVTDALHRGPPTSVSSHWEVPDGVQAREAELRRARPAGCHHG
jgi:hypothetical protein